jgi:hypothetical protein
MVKSMRSGTTFGHSQRTTPPWPAFPFGKGFGHDNQQKINYFSKLREI